MLQNKFLLIAQQVVRKKESMPKKSRQPTLIGQSAVVLPGSLLVPLELMSGITPSIGTYFAPGRGLVATRAGVVLWEADEVSVLPKASQKGPNGSVNTPAIGTLVHLRVTRLSRGFAAGDLLAVEGCWTDGSFRGTIRLDDAKPAPKDAASRMGAIAMTSQGIAKCFRLGDIVLAQVVGLADAKSYQLSTIHPCCGVVLAQAVDGRRLTLVQGQREFMKLENTGVSEPRWTPLT